MGAPLPTLGAKGVFQLLAPYDTLINTSDEYSCQGMRTLVEITASGTDAFETYYAPFGLTQTDFNNDLNLNVSIISLQSVTGNWVYVPSSYINNVPITSGVQYQVTLIGVSLGPLPVAHDLSLLKTDISNLVRDRLGWAPTIKEIKASKVKVVTYDNHVVISNNRQAAIVNNQSDYTKYVITQTRLDDAIVKIRALEDYIKLHTVLP